MDIVMEIPVKYYSKSWLQTLDMLNCILYVFKVGVFSEKQAEKNSGVS